MKDEKILEDMKRNYDDVTYNKYEEILNEIDNNKIDITKLYILSCLPTQDEERYDMLSAIYDLWLEIDKDICLARLCDLIYDNWEDYKNEEYDIDDIIYDLFD